MWLRLRLSTSGLIPAVIAIIGSMMVMGSGVAVTDSGATGSGVVAAKDSGAMGSGVTVTDCKGGRFAVTTMEEPELACGQEIALRQAHKGH